MKIKESLLINLRKYYLHFLHGIRFEANAESVREMLPYAIGQFPTFWSLFAIILKIKVIK
jgi:hypothetical protein